MKQLALLFLIASLQSVVADEAATEEAATPNGWDWNRIVGSSTVTSPIIANGNVFPPPPTESANDCLVLVTRNQFMWHCPELTLDANGIPSPDSSDSNDNSSNSNDSISSQPTQAILYRGDFGGGRRFRGAVSAPGTDRRRLWLLDSPQTHDLLLELDTVTGEILQTLEIADTQDGHDLVRVGNALFMVDTRFGNIVEIELPASAAPYRESSLEAGATAVQEEGYVNILKVHGGFTRSDHVNNVAIHEELLLSNLHGKGKLIEDAATGVRRPVSPTRLSALSRTKHGELGAAEGFTPVQNVGTMCHGIAFWQDDAATIYLLSLDSKSGTLVSVSLTGPTPGTRTVLWTPDLTHPVLIPPEGIAKAYAQGSSPFSKGLAVQGGIAYFGVSYARAPALRQTVPESLLVAVELKSGRELFARTIRSNGLINQIVTVSHLGWVLRLPEEVSTVELTHHTAGGTGESAEQCTDIINDPTNPAQVQFCKKVEQATAPGKCLKKLAAEKCCVCDGGNWKRPITQGSLDEEALLVADDKVAATSTFVHQPHCRNSQGQPKHLPLEMKSEANIYEHLHSLDQHLEYVVRHICNVNVQPLADKLLNLNNGNMTELFTNEYQQQHGNGIITARKGVATKIKPGCTSMQFIFSSRDAMAVYQFPWLQEWLPLLQSQILEPLGIPLNKIIRMMFAFMPGDGASRINFHRDRNPWVGTSHRVHIPILTNHRVFFLTELYNRHTNTDAVLRIKSLPGDVYEFNNAMPHAVRNLGVGRVHLILDWVEDPEVNPLFGFQPKHNVTLRPGESCAQLMGKTYLTCDGDGGDGADFTDYDYEEEEEKEASITHPEANNQGNTAGQTETVKNINYSSQEF